LTAPRQRLRHIQPRRRYSGGGAGHTWFVRITKLILPIAALVLVGVIVAKMSQDQVGRLTPAETTGNTTAKAGEIDLVKPKYEGLDAQNRPYTVSADKAHRIMDKDHPSAQIVDLENPVGDILMDDGTWLAAKSAKGLFNNSDNSLYLSGGVIFFHDSGYEMHMTDVHIDIKTRHAQTDLPVQGQGPAGGINAQNLEITDGGDLIIFGGPAHLTLWNLHGTGETKEKRG
jgi:lipopolysaccharide export system protein LptC